MATLKDVARLAGVSVKTVSNVVNGYSFVKPDNRARVEAALEATGYRPNLGARNLRRGRTGFIALVLTAIRVAESRDEHARRPDLPGFVLFSGALACLVYALIESGRSGFSAAS